jgi:toxin ParE1/3/4
MSGRILRRPRAEADIAEQAAWYLREGGAALGERCLAAVQRTAERLLASPGLGPSREYLNPRLEGLRMFPVQGFEKHLVFYRPTPDGIEIVRVLHAARNRERLLRRER